MARPKALNLKDYITEDQLGCFIANKWLAWDQAKSDLKSTWREVKDYIYATDTTTTTNKTLPWKNKTTIPKICQIRDNLYANYIATLFPRRKWLVWEASNEESADVLKTEVIADYMTWVIDQPRFQEEIEKAILDYIDYGNAIGTVEWIDETSVTPDKTQVGYVGSMIRRMSPAEIVFNPTSQNFVSSPKIERSIMTLGDVKDYLTRISTEETKQYYEDLFEYLKNYRQSIGTSQGILGKYDQIYEIEGFANLQDYIESDYVELLTFYGDIYDYENDEYLRNYQIVVADRHKVLMKQPNSSFLGSPPIYHVAWRKKQDNLWGMGPLDNLIGMQYRIDHIENLKADVFDMIYAPPIKVKGYVEPFEWAPFEQINVGDEGDVAVMPPPFQVLDANMEIGNLIALMEEMAGAPKEAMGFRSPGEKTKYEVQRLENAASRIFQSKCTQFEKYFIEPLLNACLELAQRMLANGSLIRVFDEEYKIQVFKTLTKEDISGAGRIRSIAARHFAERADMIQNLTAFANSPLYQDVKPHISTIKLSEMVENLLEIEDYDLFRPFIAISEQADAQRIAQTNSEQVMMEAQTASGMGTDYDIEDPSMQLPLGGAPNVPTQ